MFEGRRPQGCFTWTLSGRSLPHCHGDTRCQTRLGRRTQSAASFLVGFFLLECSSPALRLLQALGFVLALLLLQVGGHIGGLRGSLNQNHNEITYIPASAPAPTPPHPLRVGS